MSVAAFGVSRFSFMYTNSIATNTSQYSRTDKARECTLAGEWHWRLQLKKRATTIQTHVTKRSKTDTRKHASKPPECLWQLMTKQTNWIGDCSCKYGPPQFKTHITTRSRSDTNHAHEWIASAQTAARFHFSVDGTFNPNGPRRLKKNAKPESNGMRNQSEKPGGC